MAPDCRFGGTFSENLAIQLVKGCRDNMAQKLCLRMKDLNLDEIILTMRTEEVAENTQDALGVKTLLKASTEDRNKSCSGCGSAENTYGSPPKDRPVTTAADTTFDYFAKVCRQRLGTGERQQLKHVEEPLEEEATIDQANTGRVSRIMTTAEMSNGSRFKPIEIEVDTGADATTITHSVYQHKFSQRSFGEAQSHGQKFQQPADHSPQDIQDRNPDVRKNSPGLYPRCPRRIQQRAGKELSETTTGIG